MKTRQSTIAGFTLIEFLLYMTISVVMIVLIGTIGITVISGNVKAQALEEVRYNAEFAMEKMMIAVHAAESITVPEPWTSSNTLVLVNEDAALNPTIFGVSEGKVYQKVGSLEPQFLTSERTVVGELVFRNVSFSEGGDTLQIVLTVEIDAPNRVDQPHSSTTYRTTIHIPYKSS